MTTSQKEASPLASRKRALSPGRPRAATIQARQDRLMDIVTAEFLTYGYEGANIARVARTAGVSPKTIYAALRHKGRVAAGSRGSSKRRPRAKDWPGADGWLNRPRARSDDLCPDHRLPLDIGA